MTSIQATLRVKCQHIRSMGSICNIPATFTQYYASSISFTDFTHLMLIGFHIAMVKPATKVKNKIK